MPKDEWPDLAAIADPDNTLGLRDRPAVCAHRCGCDCHKNSSVKHAWACCGGCGKGHSQIVPVMLRDHLAHCHRGK